MSITAVELIVSTFFKAEVTVELFRVKGPIVYANTTHNIPCHRVGRGGGVHDHVTPDVSCEKGTGKNSAQVVYLEVHGRLNG